MGTKCLVKVTKGKSVFRVINSTGQHIHLAQNKIVAITYDMVEAKVFSFDDMEDAPFQESRKRGQNQNSQKSMNLILRTDLKQHEKEQILDFLHKNDYIFSEDSHDLGCIQI